jgi:hypothetical protein
MKNNIEMMLLYKNHSVNLNDTIPYQTIDSLLNSVYLKDFFLQSNLKSL